jgi:hypothetical protein
MAVTATSRPFRIEVPEEQLACGLVGDTTGPVRPPLLPSTPPRQAS